MAQLKAYHLRTCRISGTDQEGANVFERHTIKLVGEVGLEKYCKFLPIRGFYSKEPPVIVKVLEKRGDKFEDLGEKAVIEAQKVVDALIKVAKGPVKVDYKAEFESQKKRNDDLEARLKALENKPKPGPKSKAPKQKDNE